MDNESIIEVTEIGVLISWPSLREGFSGSMIRFVDYPLLRDVVIRLVNAVVDRHRADLFDKKFRRDPLDRLVYRLHSIRIEKNTLTISTKSGETITKSAHGPPVLPLVRELRASIEHIEKEPEGRRDMLLARAWGQLIDLQEQLLKSGPDPDFITHVRGVLAGVRAVEMTTDDHKEGQKQLTEKADQLIALARRTAADTGSSAAAETGSFEAPASPQEMVIEAVKCDSHLLTLKGRRALSLKVRTKQQPCEYSLRCEGNLTIEGLVRRIREAIIGTAIPSVRSALRDESPGCLRCGECCRNFKVELSPFDIERIAAFCRITVEDMWDRYLSPGAFSWNEGYGMLAKSACPAIDGHRSVDERPEDGCVFLGNDGEGHFICTIYQVRPEVCRDYPAGSSGCAQRDQQKGILLPPENLVSFEVWEDVIFIETKKTIADDDPPACLYLSQDHELRKICRLLHSEAIALAAGAAGF